MRIPALLLLLGLSVAAPAASQEGGLAREWTQGNLEVVHTFTGAMPTGVTVSREGRIFVNFPRWGDQVDATVAELRNGQVVPFPDTAIQRPDPVRASETLLSVQSVVVGPDDRLWILDTGRIQWGAPPAGGPKLLGVNLATGAIEKRIVFPADVALPTTYLNDVRFARGHALVTDSSRDGGNGIIVADLDTGASWRRLHGHPSTLPEPNFLPLVEGRPLMNRPAPEQESYVTVGADGLALSPDGERLFYSPLAGRRLFSVSVDALLDRSMSDDQVAATVVDHGDKGGASDGLESDTTGRIYMTQYEHNAITMRHADGTHELLMMDPQALWPDTMALADDGFLYFTANQLHRQAGFHYGKDVRQKPYVLFRIPAPGQPIRL